MRPPPTPPPRNAAVWSAPHELWTVAAGVLARVLRGGSLKGLLAPMRSECARPVNAIVTETLKKRRLLEKFVHQCGPWEHGADEQTSALRLLLAHETLFGNGLRQRALLRPTDDATLAETLERMRGWQATTLKAARTAGRSLPTASPADAAPSELPALPRYARVNTLKASTATD